MIDGWTTTTPHSNYHRHCSHARQAFLAIANGLSAFRSFIGLKHGGDYAGRRPSRVGVIVIDGWSAAQHSPLNNHSITKE